MKKHSATVGTLPQESLLHNTLSVLNTEGLVLFSQACVGHVSYKALFGITDSLFLCEVMELVRAKADSDALVSAVPALMDLAAEMYEVSRQPVMSIPRMHQFTAAAHLVEAVLQLVDMAIRLDGLGHVQAASVARHCRMVKFHQTRSLKAEKGMLDLQIKAAESLFHKQPLYQAEIIPLK